MVSIRRFDPTMAAAVGSILGAQTSSAARVAVSSSRTSSPHQTKWLAASPKTPGRCVRSLALRFAVSWAEVSAKATM